MDPEPRPEYWFPAKTYGWGWGPPRRWQGWAVLLGYFVLMALGLLLFALPHETVGYVLYSFGLTAVLIAVCWWKGERPRWRWGPGSK